MIAEWLINPSSRNLGLKNLAWTRLGVEMTPIDDLIGSGSKQITMDRVPVEQAAPYACADVDMTLRLANLLQPELHEKALWSLFSEVEMPLVPVIVDMQRAGVKLDVDFLAEMSRELGERLGRTAGARSRARGPRHQHQLHPSSSAWPCSTRWAWPSPGCAGASRATIPPPPTCWKSSSDKHPVVELILEHRQLSKLKGTYVDALPALVNPRTGGCTPPSTRRARSPGRFSSSNPNLQNIPIRTELGREIRRAFVAEEGWLLLAADYSQVELRVLAHISGDPAMLAAFARGEDIHASTAAAIYGVPLDEVTSRAAPRSQDDQLCHQLRRDRLWPVGADRAVARKRRTRFIQTYFRDLSQGQGLHRPHAGAGPRAGLRRDAAGPAALLSRAEHPEPRVHHNVREAAYRMAINAPIQGTAADILKVAMNRLWRELQARGLRSRMILQVHDELVLEVPEDELDEVAPLVVETMEGAYHLDAPLKVDAKVGRNWLEMEAYRR